MDTTFGNLTMWSITPVDNSTTTETTAEAIAPSEDIEQKSIHPVLDLQTYIDDGFVHCCDINNQTSTSETWFYKNIQSNVMYDSDKGWVYLIVANGVVQKVGETSAVLGMRPSYSGSQPVGGTSARLSRYRIHKDNKRVDTDTHVRKMIQPFLDDQQVVSFWVKKCTNPTVITMLYGEEISMKSSYNMALEKKILARIVEETGGTPFINKNLS